MSGNTLSRIYSGTCVIWTPWANQKCSDYQGVSSCTKGLLWVHGLCRCSHFQVSTLTGSTEAACLCMYLSGQAEDALLAHQLFHKVYCRCERRIALQFNTDHHVHGTCWHYRGQPRNCRQLSIHCISIGLLKGIQ